MRLVELVVLAALGAAMAGCAHKPPVVVGQGSGGVADATIDGKGRVHMTVRQADATYAKVEIKPGDPAYQALFDQLENGFDGKATSKPKLVWEIGKPVYGP